MSERMLRQSFEERKVDNMGMPIEIKSLGFLEGLPEKIKEKLRATEYRDSMTTEIKIFGEDLDEVYNEIISRFMVWYPPQGYDTRGKKSVTTNGEPVIVLSRYLTCD